MTDSMIFQEGVLNIFTDASIKVVGKNKWDGCSGAISYDTDVSRVDEKLVILRDCTNNIAELTAIEIGVDMAIDNVGRYSRINLFSDSRISVLGLRDWFWKWIHYYKGQPLAEAIEHMKCMYSSTGEPVKNSIIILNIISKICSINPNITMFNIYHCKGHSKTNVYKVQSTFLEVNRIRISVEDASLLAHCNDEVDNLTRDILLEDIDGLERTVVPFAICPTYVGLYRHIIGGRKF